MIKVSGGSDVPKKYLDKPKGVHLRTDWWNAEEERGKHAYETALKLRSDANWRLVQDERAAKFYSINEARAHQIALTGFSTIEGRELSRITLNAIKACVDTACAKIAKNRARPLFLTERGSGLQQKNAKRMTQYMDGQFDDLKVYAKGQQVFFQGCVYGTGALKCYEMDDEIQVEPVLVSELFVDEVDGLYGNPRTLYQVRFMHKSVALAIFGTDDEKKKAIDSASCADHMPSGNPNPTEMIAVVESWHLPLTGSSKDGRHIIATDNVTLFEEEWEHDYFPFAFFRWSPRLLGFYGGGLPEELQGLQIEINRMLRDMAEVHKLHAIPRILAASSSQLRNMTNALGSIATYVGEKPEFVTPVGFNPEVYQHLERLYNRAFEISGVSQMSATSKKPSGLDSGAALREFNDIETERFALVGQRFEQMYMDLARIIVDLSKKIHKGEGKVRIKGEKFIETIEWAKVDLEDDKFTMRVFPASMLPTTPAGKIQTVQEMFKEGLMEKEQAQKLLDFPDLEDFTSLMNAAMDDIKETIDRMLEDGEAVAVDPILDLSLCVRIGQSSILRAKRDGIPEENINIVRAWVAQCAQMLKAAQTPPPAPPGPPPGPVAPPAAPMPPAMPPAPPVM